MNELLLLTEFYTQFNSNEARVTLENSLNKNVSDEEFWNATKAYFEAELTRLKELQDKVKKVSSLISSPLATELSQSIDSMISHLTYASSFTDEILKDSSIDTSKYDSEVDHFLHDYREFGEIVNKTYPKYQESLYNAAKLGVISIDALIEIRDNDHLNREQKKVVSEVLEQVKKEKEHEEPVEEEKETMSEQTDMEDEKGKSSNLDTSTEDDYLLLDEEEIIDLEEEHATYAGEVTNESLTKELAVLNKRAQELTKIKEEKGKLSLRQSIELQALHSQILQLSEYSFELTRKQEKRERKINDLGDKISDRKGDLARAKENQARSKSQLFKNLSARKQRKLEEKLKVLQGKLVVVKDEQRTSALVKFDKVNKKIAKKAKRDVITNMVKETAIDVRDKTVGAIKEAGNIASDIGRYVRNSALMKKLKTAKIKMVGAPSELEIQPEEREIVASI